MYKGYNTLEYDSWSNFKSRISFDLCGKPFFSEKKYVFRGQRNQNWPLISGFDRIFGVLDFKRRKQSEESLISEFRNCCRDLKENDRFISYSDIEILSIGQHYGLPTRLLDWTYSLYTAAFFAFGYNKSDDSKQISIWVIDMEHEVWNSDLGVEIVKSKLIENEYQKKQRGIFTLNKSPHISLEEFVLACSKRCDINGALTQILIPYSEREIALNDLDMMNINHMYLFPGLEGCAQTATLKEFLKLNLV